MEYNVKGLNKLSKELNEFVVRAGFDNNDVPLRIALIHSEISEAFEAFRNDKIFNVDNYNDSVLAKEFETDGDLEEGWRMRFKTYVKDTMEDELADSVIRLLDLCGKLNIDIEWHIQNKMKYNETRGHKYGGKKF